MSVDGVDHAHHAVPLDTIEEYSADLKECI